MSEESSDTMSEGPSEEKPRRPLAQRALGWGLLVVVVVGLVAYGVQEFRMRRLQATAETAVSAEIVAKGKAMGETLAVTLRDRIASGKTGGIAEEIDELVRTPDITLIVVVDTDGEVVFSTDKKLLGTSPQDEQAKKALDVTKAEIFELTDDSAEIAVPVLSYTEKVATVRVRVRTDRASETIR